MITISNLVSENASSDTNKTLIIEAGEILGIIGQAGSGKTSLLKAIAGIPAGYGDITISGKKISDYDKHEKIRLISHNTAVSMNNINETLRDFLILSRLPFKKSFQSFGNYDYELCEKYSSQLGLTEYLDSPIANLSESLRKKSIICFAMIREPSVLILDEPSAGLDIRSTSQLTRALTRFVSTGNRIVLCASNDINFTLQVSDRIAIMQNNLVAGIFKPVDIDSGIITEFFQTETLTSRNIYNGRPMIHYLNEN